MTADRIFNLAGSIVVVAMVTVIVSHRNTATVINSVGSAFSGSLRAAMGK